MAIEKMAMIHLVGEKADLDDITREIILFGKMHVVNAMQEIEASDYESKMPTLEEGQTRNSPFSGLEGIPDYRSHYEKVERIMGHLNIRHKSLTQKLAEEEVDLPKAEGLLEKLYPELEEIQTRLKELKAYKDYLGRLKALTYIDDTSLELSKVFKMKHFGLKLGLLTKESRSKLSQNYENIDAIFMHLGEVENKEAMLVAYPLEIELDTERLLRSAYFEEVEVPEDYWMNASEIPNKILAEQEATDIELAALELKKKNYRKTYKEELRYVFNLFTLELTKNQMKKQIVTTKNFVLLSGWIPERFIHDLDKRFAKKQLNVVINVTETGQNEVNELAPTRLNNNWLFRPFEMLVKLYGIPTYGEIDPTPFFAVIYMILFGAMFGDVGQGFVFVVVGILSVTLKKQAEFGAIISRLGISSMFFGTIYDSFFGYEGVISELAGKIAGKSPEEMFFIHPLENINLLLVASIAFGIVLLYISFGYGIYNKLKARDIEEGVFGRNGIVGLLFYTAFLAVVGHVAGLLQSNWMPVLLGLCGVGLLLILVRQPLTNLILGHRPLYHEPKGEYYMESGFETVETILTLFSNTMSFIRVGAFALNHVGLFVAFHTMAALIGGAVGEVSMFIVGNIIILVLEGLIVFIQGLRLMFYELFSKYYSGEGFDYQPIQL